MVPAIVRQDIALQADMPAISPEKLAKMETLWTNFGWSEPASPVRDLLATHLPSAMFLKRSGLLFPIRAYQQSLQQAVANFERELGEAEANLLEGIHLDDAGHPMILKEGEWVRCDQLEQELVIDPNTRVISSKDNPDIHWSYSYPNGLIQTRDDEFLPCYRLSQREVVVLKERLNTESNYFFQVFTGGTTPLEKFGHISCRLVNGETGDVHSFGLGRPEEQGVHPITSQFSVFDTKVYSDPDFEEFALFKARNVTSLPVEQGTFQELVDKVEQYAKSSVSFHFMRQNCVKFTADLLKIAGHEVEVMCTVTDLISDLNPEGIEGIAYVGTVYAKIKGIVKPIFSFIHTIAPDKAVRAFDKLVVVVLFIPNKTLTLIRNIFIISFGGTTSAFPLRQAEEDTIENQDRMTSFSRLMTLSLPNLFNDDVGRLASPLKIAQWQARQDTTVAHQYAKGPMFNIVPPAAVAVEA